MKRVSQMIQAEERSKWEKEKEILLEEEREILKKRVEAQAAEDMRLAEDRAHELEKRLHTEKKDFEKHHDDAKKNAENARTKIAELTSGVAKLKNDLDVERSASRNDQKMMEHKCNLLDARVDQLQEENDRLKNAVEISDLDATQLRNEAEILGFQIYDLENQLADAQDTLSASEENKSSMTTELEEMTRLYGVSSEAESSLKTGMGEMKRLHNESQRREKSSTLELETLKELRAEADRDIADMKTRFAELQEKHIGYEDLESSHRSLEKKVAYQKTQMISQKADFRALEEKEKHRYIELQKKYDDLKHASAEQAALQTRNPRNNATENESKASSDDISVMIDEHGFKVFEHMVIVMEQDRASMTKKLNLTQNLLAQATKDLISEIKRNAELEVMHRKVAKNGNGIANLSQQEALSMFADPDQEMMLTTVRNESYREDSARNLVSSHDDRKAEEEHTQLQERLARRKKRNAKKKTKEANLDADNAVK